MSDLFADIADLQSFLNKAQRPMVRELISDSVRRLKEVLTVLNEGECYSEVQNKIFISGFPHSQSLVGQARNKSDKCNGGQCQNS